MNHIKHLLSICIFVITVFSISAQATDNIYKMDTIGGEDSPKPLSDLSIPNQTKKTNSQYLELNPSATLWGFAGKKVLGKAQGMLPFGGDGIQSTFYAALEGAGTQKEKNGYAAGVGGGYRRIFGDSYILGGYFLADYNRSPGKHSFWVGSFGFEALSYVWDLRANAYLPIGKKYWLSTDTDSSYHEETSTGVDVEIGRILPIPNTKGVKLFVGGYHFLMSRTDKVSGVEARLVFPINRYISLEGRNSYDDVRRNVAMGGIRITLGGYDDESRNNLGIISRLSDPIERNFANFAACNTSVVNKKNS